MDEIDKFLNFLLENIGDPRISTSKDMKNGHRYYYISIVIENKSDKSTSVYNSTSHITITIDNRNKCIKLDSNDENILIEDELMVSKWSEVLENHISKNINEKVSKIIENTLGSCAEKDLHREYKMKKILKDDEFK